MSANSNGQAAQQQQQQPSHGPYRPTTWPMGGTPEIGVDVPITAVFLALFMIGAATHMYVFVYPPFFLLLLTYTQKMEEQWLME